MEEAKSCRKEEEETGRSSQKQEVVGLTAAGRVLGRCTLVCPCCPARRSVLAEAEEGHGLEVQLPIWVRFGGHGHAVQETRQNRVAGRGGT